MSGFTWAPIFMCYGNNNRTNMMRIPMAGGRVECRAADIACNFYLGAAMVLAAGLEGVVEKLDPGEPNTENMYLVEPGELRRRGIERLPQTLAEAVAEFEKDELSRKVMGDTMYRAFIAYKKEEWRKYHTHISDWELKEYLRFF
jgi:glutamine synthetase